MGKGTAISPKVNRWQTGNEGDAASGPYASQATRNVGCRQDQHQRCTTGAAVTAASRDALVARPQAQSKDVKRAQRERDQLEQ